MVRARHLDDLDKSLFKVGDILRPRNGDVTQNRVIISVVERGLVTESAFYGGHRALEEWRTVYYCYDTKDYEKSIEIQE